MKDDVLKIEEIIRSILDKTEYHGLHVYSKNRQLLHINQLLHLDFNIKFIEHTVFTFENLAFFADYFISQTSPFQHPLTCGSDSSHQLLFPRIDYNGQKYMICMDCGYVQKI